MPSANQAPFITTGATITLLEDGYHQFSAGDFYFSDANDTPSNNFLNLKILSLPTECGTLYNGSTAVQVDDIIPVTTIDAGLLKFVAAADCNGVDGFFFAVQDDGGTGDGGQDTSQAWVMPIVVTAVNDKPDLTGSDVTVNEDAGAVTISSWATFNPGGGSDEATQTALYLVSNPSNPALFTQAPAVDSAGNLTFTLADNANGLATFYIQVQDDGGTTNGGVNLSGAQMFTITVNAVNDAPTFTVGSDVTVVEDSGAYSSVWATSISTGPANEGQSPTFTVSNDNAALFTAAPSIAADGTLSFTPAANIFGTATVTVSLGDGVDSTTPVTFTITVTAVNDAPVGTPDNYTIPHDQTLDVQSLDGVLANDTDADGDMLEAYVVDPPTHGTVTLDTDGGFVYTPSVHFVGDDTFTYYVTDGVAPSSPITVTIHVTNAATTAREDRYHVDATLSLNIDANWGVLSNDEDEDDTLTAALVAGPAHASSFTLNADGSFDYTADGTFAGSDQFTYAATDAIGGVQVATVYLTSGAVARDDGYVVNHGRILTITADIGLVANDSYDDPSTTVFVVGTGPSHGTLTLADDGSFTYTQSDPNYVGLDQFTYSLSGSSSPLVVATVKITIVDEKPVAVFDTYTVDLNTALTVGAANGVLANDNDPEGDAMTVSLVQAPVNGTISLNSTGAFTYNPNTAFAGTEIVTYRVLDQNGNPGQETAVKFLVAQPAAAITVSGRMRYDAAPNQKNVRGATVLLQTWQLDWTGGSWRTMDYSTTDSTGNYTLTFDATNRSTYRVLVMASNRSEAGTNRFVHVVSNNPLQWQSLTDHVFACQRPLSGPIGANVIGFDFNLGETRDFEQAFWTFDAAYSAVKAHAAITGVAAAATHVAIEYHPFGTTSVTPFQNRIFLADGSYKDWDTIDHEYGHIVQRVHGFFPFPLMSFSERGGAFAHDAEQNLRLTNQTVNFNRPLDRVRANKLAFSEGFAEFYSMYAQESDATAPRFDFGPGVGTKDMKTLSYTVENEDVGRSNGEDEELTVMRVLWDLFDNSPAADDDGYDVVSLGFQEVFNLIANLPAPQPGCVVALTLSDFCRNFLARNSAPAGPTPVQLQLKYAVGDLLAWNNIAVWTGDDDPQGGGTYSGGDPTATWSAGDPIPDFWFKVPQGQPGEPAVAELLNTFSIVFHNADYTADIARWSIGNSLTSFAGNANWKKWTPDAAQWGIISAAAGLKHWSINGFSFDGLQLISGSYWCGVADLTIS